MKNIKVTLSVQGLNELAEKINTLKNDLKKVDKKIVEKLSDYTISEIQNNYSATSFKDGNDDVSFFQKGSETKRTVGVTGTQVLYNEFGTGTQGEQSPHPLKSNYGLHGYNTGKKIRKATIKVNEISGLPIGVKYWTYKNKSGETVYTTGIPAGLQVYNAAQSLKLKKQQIIKQEVSDVLSKL